MSSYDLMNGVSNKVKLHSGSNGNCFKGRREHFQNEGQRLNSHWAENFVVKIEGNVAFI